MGWQCPTGNACRAGGLLSVPGWKLVLPQLPAPALLGTNLPLQNCRLGPEQAHAGLTHEPRVLGINTACLPLPTPPIYKGLGRLAPVTVSSIKPAQSPEPSPDLRAEPCSQPASAHSASAAGFISSPAKRENRQQGWDLGGAKASAGMGQTQHGLAGPLCPTPGCREHGAPAPELASS